MFLPLGRVVTLDVTWCDILEVMASLQLVEFSASQAQVGLQPKHAREHEHL